MRRALGPARWRRSAGCGLVPLLLFGLSPAGSAAAALSLFFSRTLYSFLCTSDYGRLPYALLCRNCTALVTGSRGQRECGSVVRAYAGGIVGERCWSVGLRRWSVGMLRAGASWSCASVGMSGA